MNEEETKIAIAMWVSRACKAEAEIDRLRHDIERMQEIDSEHLAEIDRLRQTSDHWEAQYHRVFQDMDRLCAENKILRDYISWLGFDIDAVITEAKAASHQPASDQEQQKSS